MLVVPAPSDTRNRNGSWYECSQIKQGISSLLDKPEYHHPTIPLLYQAVQKSLLYFKNVGWTGSS